MMTPHFSRQRIALCLSFIAQDLYASDQAQQPLPQPRPYSLTTAQNQHLAAPDQPNANPEPTVAVLPTLQLRATANTAATNSQSTASTKFAHDVLDVPLSRSFVSATELQNRQINRIDQALNLVAGVSAQNNYGGGFWDNFAIRGFATDQNLGAAIIRNGLSVNRGLNARRDVVNIESLEFLKGPAAALYGRGELGGLLNVNTRKPQWTPLTRVIVRGASPEQYRLSLEQSNALSDQVAYRLAAAVEDNQSFRDKVYSKRVFVSPQLSWNISDQTQLNFDSELTQQKGLFDRGVSSLNGTFPINRDTFLGEPQDAASHFDDYFVQLRLKHQFNSNWQLQQAVSYKDANLQGFSSEPRRFQADGRTLERQRRQRDFDSRDLLLQTELLGQLDSDFGRHELLLSAEIGRLNYDQRLNRVNHSATNPNTIDVFNPVYGVFLPRPPAFTNTRDQQSSWALNVQDQWFYSDAFSIMAGVRYDQVKQDFENRLSNKIDAKAFKQASPRVGINYKLQPDWSVYANYGRSFAMNSGIDRLGAVLAPEQGHGYELGSHYAPADNQRLNLALYRMLKSHVVTADPIDPAFFITAAEIQSQGIEFEYQAELSPAWQLSANAAYTDAAVGKDPNLVKGSRLLNVPKHSAGLMLNYEFLQQGATRAGVGAQALYVGTRSSNSSDNGFDLPRYSLLNLSSYYQLNDTWRLGLNLDNVFDRVYYSNSISSVAIQPGAPRNVVMSVQWQH